MAHELPTMQYGYDPLEPHIDARTMKSITRSITGGMSKLNAALEGNDEMQDLPLVHLLGKLSELPDEIRTVVRNNRGGHTNHSLVLGDHESGRRWPTGR